MTTAAPLEGTALLHSSGIGNVHGLRACANGASRNDGRG